MATTPKQTNKPSHTKRRDSPAFSPGLFSSLLELVTMCDVMLS